VCLLQDSKTQLAGLRCCHWLLAGSSSNSAAGWAASWCWQHCGCLVQILQGHSPLLQAWVSRGGRSARMHSRRMCELFCWASQQQGCAHMAAF
jgi:hypothetical protein